MDESLECLFNLMDVDRDGLVDEEELVSGIRHMFSSEGNIRAGATQSHASSFSPEEVFHRMDADGQGRLYVSDVESFVMPHLRQILQLGSVNKTNFSLTLSEMTGNVSLFIMRKADIDKNGFIEQVDITNLSLDDPVAYQLLTDMVTFAPDFMDKHRAVINNAGQNQKTNSIASVSIAKKVAGSLKNSVNRDLSNMQQ